MSEVVELAKHGQIRHSVTMIRLEEVNETPTQLRVRDIVGRAVITF